MSDAKIIDVLVEWEFTGRGTDLSAMDRDPVDLGQLIEATDSGVGSTVKLIGTLRGDGDGDGDGDVDVAAEFGIDPEVGWFLTLQFRNELGRQTVVS